MKFIQYKHAQLSNKSSKNFNSRTGKDKQFEATWLVTYSAQILSRFIEKKAEVIYMELIWYFSNTQESFRGPWVNLQN